MTTLLPGAARPRAGTFVPEAGVGARPGPREGGPEGAPVQVGETFKHYRIIARLGEGGMGVVYRAEDTRLGRTVALKVFPPDMALDPERVERFEREARAASAISHPGIATLYDFDHDGPTAFLTMEYVEGKTLRQLLQQGCLLMPQLLDCLAQVAEALAAAHRKGIIHRD
ncbi:MAG TPA: serine/threonine-protein kinase, partial [Candidatus Polarisedimenticolia bacterium]|nr:serine/threonine-protein kinase [Candidatus Polarisedimenticolia bacterium]